MRSLALLLLVSACRSTPAPAPMAADDVRVERRPCLARCPTYVVEATSAGVVRFVGASHVAREGEATRTLDEAARAAVVRLLEAADTAGWPTKADARLADAQRVTLSFRGGTWHHAIGGEGSAALEAFLAELEARLGISEWVTGGATQ
jgi:Mg-chelatase subunit ChlI